RERTKHRQHAASSSSEPSRGMPLWSRRAGTLAGGLRHFIRRTRLGGAGRFRRVAAAASLPAEAKYRRSASSMHRLSNRQRIATGGKAIYGAPLGILMLEARFPRIPGDMGNAQTWPFPVLYKVIK